MITHTWINTALQTKGLRKYYNYYRFIVGSFPIMILRNQFDAAAGIWIVGEKELIEELSRQIKTVIKTVEDKGNRKKFKELQETHRHKIKADYKEMVLSVLIQGLKEIMQKEFKGLPIEEILGVGKELRNEYIEQSSSLKNLKSFRAKS